MPGIVAGPVAMIPLETYRSTEFYGEESRILCEICTSLYIHHDVDDKTFSSFSLMFDLKKKNTKCSLNPDPQNPEEGEFIGNMERVICKLISLLTK